MRLVNVSVDIESTMSSRNLRGDRTRSVESRGGPSGLATAQWCTYEHSLFREVYSPFVVWGNPMFSHSVNDMCKVNSMRTGFNDFINSSL